MAYEFIAQGAGNANFFKNLMAGRQSGLDAKGKRTENEINAYALGRAKTQGTREDAAYDEQETAKALYPIISRATSAQTPQEARQVLATTSQLMGDRLDDDDRAMLSRILQLDDDRLGQGIQAINQRIETMLGVKREPYTLGPGEQRFGPDNKLIAKAPPKPEKEDEQVVEVADANSPTGTRYVSRKDAIGQPGKPPSGGLNIDFDPETGRPLSITTGKGNKGAGSGLTPSVATDVQKRVINAGDTLSQLTAIKSQFRPEYQQLGTRWSALTSSFKSKAGFNLTGDERTLLDNFTTYRSGAAQLFSDTLKTLSGAAVTPAEMKRAEGWLPNPGTGLMDGDSPEELRSKVTRFEDFTRKALAKYSYISRYGLKADDIGVDEMPKIIQKRGDTIATELQAKGLMGDELKQAVKMRLADEFGLAAY